MTDIKIACSVSMDIGGRRRLPPAAVAVDKQIDFFKKVGDSFFSSVEQGLISIEYL